MIMPIPESVNSLHPIAPFSSSSSSSADALRLELKAWEKEFAAAHHGQKAGREDIKRNPEIGIHFPSAFLYPNKKKYVAFILGFPKSKESRVENDC